MSREKEELDCEKFEEAVRAVFLERIRQIAKILGIEPAGVANKIKLRSTPGSSRRTLYAIEGASKNDKPQKVTFSDICKLAGYLEIKPSRLVAEAEAYYASEIEPSFPAAPKVQKKTTT